MRRGAIVASLAACLPIILLLQSVNAVGSESGIDFQVPKRHRRLGAHVVSFSSDGSRDSEDYHSDDSEDAGKGRTPNGKGSAGKGMSRPGDDDDDGGYGKGKGGGKGNKSSKSSKSSKSHKSSKSGKSNKSNSHPAPSPSRPSKPTPVPRPSDSVDMRKLCLLMV